MSSAKLSKIRNIGIVAHIDAGKTTVTERILFYTGKTHKMGEVHDGEAVMDWMPQEQERGITITSTVTACPWRNHEIHLIDTPGHVDFTIEVERSLRVLDGVVVVFCAVAGVESQSETVWHQADKYGVPKLAFINKMDRLGADYFRTIETMRERFASTPLPIQIPFFKNGIFLGSIDLIRRKCLTWDEASLGHKYEFSEIPTDHTDEAEEYREQLVEGLAELDDRIAELYIEGENIPESEIIDALRRAVLSLKAVPVLCGSALRNKGVQPVLDGVIDFLPSPEEAHPVKGVNPLTGEGELLESNSKSPLAALAFKVMTDEGRKITYIRIYSGQISSGDEVYNANQRKRERVARLIKMHANKRERVKKAVAGDIVVAVGLKDTVTGDTLCDEKHPILLEKIKFYEPVISRAIEPKTPDDQSRLSLALEKLTGEDPTLKVKFDDETAQTVISGMGELHLEIVIDRLVREFNTNVNVGKPRVVYRETIETEVDSEEIFDKKLGEKKHHGHVALKLIPNTRSGGIQIINDTDPDALPSHYLQIIEQSIRDTALSGPLAGYPVVDVIVRIKNASYLEGESSELGYQVAASTAFQNGIAKGKPVLLEPVMLVDILSPGEFMGEVIGSINSRGGEVVNISQEIPISEIKAKVPLKHLFGYSTDLRSLTQGRATFSMRFSHYDKQ
ncbi:MAG: elongation factor G [Syntrophales bacterium]|nr:elongation factor G [Syntrophales bacterium]